VAVSLKETLEMLNVEHKRRDGYEFTPPVVSFKNGSLTDPRHLKWLTEGVCFAILNNFGDVFNGTREGTGLKKGERVLDDYVATFLALMKPGAKLVTITSLKACLRCESLSEANKIRHKHGLPESENASFYEVSEFDIGQQNQVTSWSEKSSTATNVVKAHLYTRLKQTAGEGQAVFMCHNPKCKNAQDEVTLPAVAYKTEDQKEKKKAEIGSHDGIILSPVEDDDQNKKSATLGAEDEITEDEIILQPVDSDNQVAYLASCNLCRLDSRSLRNRSRK
jgi:hypothetical protein